MEALLLPSLSLQRLHAAQPHTPSLCASTFSISTINSSIVTVPRFSFTPSPEEEAQVAAAVAEMEKWMSPLSTSSSSTSTAKSIKTPLDDSPSQFPWSPIIVKSGRNSGLQSEKDILQQFEANILISASSIAKEGLQKAHGAHLISMEDPEVESDASEADHADVTVFRPVHLCLEMSEEVPYIGAEISHPPTPVSPTTPSRSQGIAARVCDSLILPKRSFQLQSIPKHDLCPPDSPVSTPRRAKPVQSPLPLFRYAPSTSFSCTPWRYATPETPIKVPRRLRLVNSSSSASWHSQSPSNLVSPTPWRAWPLPSPSSSTPWREQSPPSPSRSLQSPSHPSPSIPRNPRTPRHRKLNNPAPATPPGSQTQPALATISVPYAVYSPCEAFFFDAADAFVTPKKTAAHIIALHAAAPRKHRRIRTSGDFWDSSPFVRGSPTPNCHNRSPEETKSPMLRMKAVVPVRDLALAYMLGKGAQGAVYLATRADVPDRNPLAVKVIKKSKANADDIVMILEETRLLRRVQSHPFVLQLEEAFHDSLNFYLVTEYHCGGDLHELVVDVGPINSKDAQLYAAELLLGIQYLHDNHIIHRDIKPANVLIKNSGHICIADFGLAKDVSSCKGANIAGDSKASKELITTGFAGTLLFMCPEMLSKLPYGFGADWWSYGVTVYCLVQGDFPWVHDQTNQILDQIINHPLEFQPNVPLRRDIRDFLIGVLQKAPCERLTVNEMKSHPFFANLDFNELLAERVAPPYVPGNRGCVISAKGLRQEEDFFCGTPYAAHDPYPEYRFKRSRFQASIKPKLSMVSGQQQHKSNISPPLSSSGETSWDGIHPPLSLRYPSSITSSHYPTSPLNDQFREEMCSREILTAIFEEIPMGSIYLTPPMHPTESDHSLPPIPSHASMNTPVCFLPCTENEVQGEEVCPPELTAVFGEILLGSQYAPLPAVSYPSNPEDNLLAFDPIAIPSSNSFSSSPSPNSSLRLLEEETPSTSEASQASPSDTHCNGPMGINVPWRSYFLQSILYWTERTGEYIRWVARLVFGRATLGGRQYA